LHKTAKVSKKSAFFVKIFRCTLFSSVQLEEKIAFFRSRIQFFLDKNFAKILENFHTSKSSFSNQNFAKKQAKFSVRFSAKNFLHFTAKFCTKFSPISRPSNFHFSLRARTYFLVYKAEIDFFS